MTADNRFADASKDLGYDFSGELKIGGNCSPVVQDGKQLFISGQIPRMGDEVLFVGAVGDGINLASAKKAAAVCVMRALALIQRAIGSLASIQCVSRMTVYVRSAPSFTQQSEVADGASDTLAKVLGSIGMHSRTSVGVLQLPKGAAVEVDLIVSIK
ncbi:RidA family protein [Paludibacterium purpuratum]|uniref:Enamine deaminase RidA (YjgF/YER057c/UK114 family) n=1 Tax=Paludibacterium purpuratum TaxID=1144873 RepID=A0A4R7AWY2_9NEIS|nr:RidA family protein [Paludibacterium purpuratum]TDR72021.1 enamine deaminase RidA (YjgF/YER057c/UK114 family) [Paludibacterium purpuratum]